MITSEVVPWLEVKVPSAPGSLTVMNSFVSHCGGGRSEKLPASIPYRVVAFAAVSGDSIQKKKRSLRWSQG